MRGSLLSELDSESLSSGDGCEEEIGDEEYQDLFAEKNVSYVRRFGPEVFESEQDVGDGILQEEDLWKSERTPPKTIKLIEQEDGSMMGFGKAVCEPQAPHRYVDFRLCIPSTKMPLTITAGPLTAECSILLSRGKRCSVDDKMWAATCKDLTHSLSVTKEDPEYQMGMYWLSLHNERGEHVECDIVVYLRYERRKPMGASRYRWTLTDKQQFKQLQALFKTQDARRQHLFGGPRMGSAGRQSPSIPAALHSQRHGAAPELVPRPSTAAMADRTELRPASAVPRQEHRSSSSARKQLPVRPASAQARAMKPAWEAGAGADAQAEMSGRGGGERRAVVRPSSAQPRRPTSALSSASSAALPATQSAVAVRGGARRVIPRPASAQPRRPLSALSAASSSSAAAAAATWTSKPPRPRPHSAQPQHSSAQAQPAAAPGISRAVTAARKGRMDAEGRGGERGVEEVVASRLALRSTNMGNTRVYPRPDSAPPTRTAAPLPPRPQSAQRRAEEGSELEERASCFPREGEPSERYATPAERLCGQVEGEGEAGSMAREVFQRGAGKEWMGLGPRRPRPASALARMLDTSGAGVSGDGGGAQGRSSAQRRPDRPASASAYTAERAAMEAGALTAAQQLEVMAALKAEHSRLSAASDLDSSARTPGGAGAVKGGSILVSNGTFLQRSASVATRRTAHVAFSDAKAREEAQHLASAPGRRLEQALGDMADLERQRTQLPQADLFVLVNKAKNLPEREREYESSVELRVEDPFRGVVAEHHTKLHSSLTHPVWEAAFKLDCRNLDQEAVIAVQCWHHPTRHTWPKVVLGAGKAAIPLRGLPRFKLVSRWVFLSPDADADATNASAVSANNTSVRSGRRAARSAQDGGGGGLASTASSTRLAAAHTVEPAPSYASFSSFDGARTRGGKKGREPKVFEGRVELKFFFGDEQSFKGFQAQHVHQQLHPNSPAKHSKLRRGSTAKVAPAGSVPFVSEPNATGSRSPWAFLRETFVSPDAKREERSKPKPTLNGAAKSVIKLLRMTSPASSASGVSRTGGSSAQSSPPSRQGSVLSSRSPSPNKLLMLLRDKEGAAARAKVREDAAADGDWEDAGVASSFFDVWRQHHSRGAAPTSKHAPLHSSSPKHASPPSSPPPPADASPEDRVSSPVFPASPIASGWRPIRRSSLVSLNVAPHTPEPDAPSLRQEPALDHSPEPEGASSPGSSRRWRRLRQNRRAVQWPGSEGDGSRAGPKLAGMEQLCPDWKTLTLSGVPAVNDAFLEHLARQRGPELFGLVLTGCGLLTQRGVQAMVSRHRMLTRVDLSGAEQTTDACVEGVVGALVQLTTLAVSRCLRLTDQALIAVGRECAGLKSFECEGCMLLTDEGCSAIARGCTCLERLSLRGCVGVGSEGVRCVGERGRTLRELCVSGLRQVSSAALVSVAQGCAGLRHLDVGMCQGADDKALEAVAASCARLQGLVLCSTGVTDVGLAAVGRRLSGLTALDLGHCRRVSDYGVFKVGSGCTRLLRLRLDACAALSDAAVTLLGDRCEALRHLSLRGCRCVSGASVAVVLEQCRQLRSLDLAGAGADEREVREAVARTAGARAAEKQAERLARLCGGKSEAEQLGLGTHMLPAEEGLEVDFGSGGGAAAGGEQELVGFRAERDLSVAQVRSLVRDLDAGAAHQGQPDKTSLDKTST